MPERWLILADDLTGAADCAIAFAQSGLPAAVIWDPDGPEETVIAIDANSRTDDAETAAIRHRRLVEQRYRPGTALFKKIDSTLRGQPAAELAETMRAVREYGEISLAIVAPAFPEAGRTLEQGAIRMHGEALEKTPLWARDHSYETANVVTVLADVGLRTGHLSLGDVRAGPEAVADRLRRAIAEGVDAVVCDATLSRDLDIVAEASMDLAKHVLWTGSAGLAQALARNRGHRAGTAIEPPEVSGGILFVVGSIAEASRAAAAVLAADSSVQQVTVTPDTLRAGPKGQDWAQAQHAVLRALGEGRDVLIEIEPGRNPDLSQGAALARRLADLLRPAAPRIGALFITGGETALALLDTLGVTGIRLIEEVEPGVPLGQTQGGMSVPVITKAGAFGDERTLHRCLHHFRRLRQPENHS
jgi:uncharacterized protein YgbK (DUF1537 family)